MPNNNDEFMTIKEAIDRCNDIITFTHDNVDGMLYYQIIKWLQELDLYRLHLCNFLNEYDDTIKKLYPTKGAYNAE